MGSAGCVSCVYTMMKEIDSGLRCACCSVLRGRSTRAVIRRRTSMRSSRHHLGTMVRLTRIPSYSEEVSHQVAQSLPSFLIFCQLIVVLTCSERFDFRSLFQYLLLFENPSSFVDTFAPIQDSRPLSVGKVNQPLVHVTHTCFSWDMDECVHSGSSSRATFLHYSYPFQVFHYFPS